MACGGVDGCVRLLLQEPKGVEFRTACKLSGHQDWVRCVAFRQPDPGDHAGEPPWRHCAAARPEHQHNILEELISTRSELPCKEACTLACAPCGFRKLFA